MSALLQADVHTAVAELIRMVPPPQNVVITAALTCLNAFVSTGVRATALPPTA